MNEPSCLRCQTRMEEGFVIDHSHYDIPRNQEWAEGEPLRSWWSGLKLKGRERHAVRTFRCPKCGYLESYAPAG